MKNTFVFRKLLTLLVIILPFFSNAQTDGIGHTEVLHSVQPQSPQNGNGSLGMTYTMTACGLNYVQASNLLAARVFPPWLVSLPQPAGYVISGIPTCATILKAYVWWDVSGTSNSGSVTLMNPLGQTNTIAGTLIGTGADKCWNRGGTRSFRADVTGAIAGNGIYQLSGLPYNAGAGDDVDGATLFIIYSDPNAGYSGSIQINDGAIVYDANIGPGGVSNTMNNINACGNSTYAKAFIIVSDLQVAQTPGTGTTVSIDGSPYASITEDFWDYEERTTSVTSGQMTSTAGIQTLTDCFNFLMQGIYFQTTSCTVCNASVLSIAATTTTASCAALGSATLSVSGGTSPYTYVWSTTPVQNTATATNLSPGTYSCTVTDATGCLTSTYTVTITGSNALTVAINATNATCSQNNGSATAIPVGTSPYTYVWSTGGSAATENNLGAGTYTCTVTDANGCVGTETITITNSSSLSTNVQSLTNVSCNGGTNGNATITVTGGNGPYTYSWSPSGGNAASASNLSSDMYSVTIVDANGCTGTQSVLITQPSAVAIVPSSTTATCGNSNGSASVVASGGTGAYTYSWTPSGGTTATATSLSAGTYSCTITDMNGCVGVASVVVTGSAPIAATTTPTNVLCNGGSNGNAIVNVTSGSGPYTYAWSPTGGTNAMANNLSAGNYSVTVTDAVGCTSVYSVTITQPQPFVLTTSGNVTLCAGDSAILSANSTGGTGSVTYIWNPGSISTNGLTVIPGSTSSYTVNATDANGCSGSQTITVTVNQPVTVQAVGTTQLCGGQSTIISANASNGGPYIWQPGNLSGPSQSVSPTVTTTYTVSVFDVCTGLSVIDSVVVSVESLTAQFLQAPAMGCGPLDVLFNDQSLVNGGSISSWLWNFGDGSFSTLQNPSHTYSIPGTYNVTLTVTSSNGCVQTFTNPNPVTVYPSPVADFSITNLPITTISPVAEFQDNSINAVSWSWTFGDGGTSSLQDPSHTYSEDTGSYQVMLVVANSYGCQDTAYSEVSVYDNFSFYIPNAFTPDGSGLNDNFIGVGVGIAEFDMKIFDRWGMLLYETNDLNRPWDGTFKGAKVEQDVYVYKINLTDIYNSRHHYIGHVSVIR